MRSMFGVLRCMDANVNMDATSVFMHLATLAPLGVLVWFLVLPTNGAFYSRVVCWPRAAVVFVPLGGYIGATVGVAFDEPLRLAPFSWVERPLFAAKVYATCAVVGGGWSYGVACLVAKLLHRLGVPNLPRQLVGTNS
ncbi:hypothetical protein BJD12_22555 (plasmid) [Xanthomonas vesicatoria ATCC 35937]|uniref:Uncharacterized protein n=4 Tax=Xanthomonas TaxID=338 RepID=A0AAJ0J263_9XANT|nr:hypothetical protein BJD12_22555 [Xanthomonas vesicatoria ATCC 35937]APP87302.1 hypothetical protein BI317_24895 [Xanthomonas hortorum pv. gardneri]KHM94880.1 hypothetical protein OR60_09720 [Xanthomonas vesicatoria]EGD10782.1 hypothetical protein XVE_0837 [Xanthomonas vesicatoria ATCC 35937]KHM98651.1 hypothetical protein OR61_00080 [Xanthomonas vesicatoria]